MRPPAVRSARSRAYGSFSPDGNTLASASRDRHRASVGCEHRQSDPHTHGHTHWVLSVSFSPDGNTLASASWDTVRLWDATTGSPLRTPHGAYGWVLSVSFSPDGNARKCKLGRSQVHAQVRGLDPMATPCVCGMRPPAVRCAPSQGIRVGSTACRFHPMATRSQVRRDNTVRLWDATTGSPLRTLTGHTSWVYSVSFSPDGNTLASASATPCVCGMRPPAVRCARSQGIRIRSTACRFHPMATRSQVEVGTTPCVCGMRPPAVRCARSQGIRLGSAACRFHPMDRKCKLGRNPSVGCRQSAAHAHRAYGWGLQRVVFTRWKHARKWKWGRHRASVGCEHRQSAAHAHRAYVLWSPACRFHPMATRSQVEVWTTPCVCGMRPPAVRSARSQGIRMGQQRVVFTRWQHARKWKSGRDGAVMGTRTHCRRVSYVGCE